MSAATFYAHVQATYCHWDKNRVNSIKVTKVTQGKPERLERNTIAVKLTLEIPDDAFFPFTPQATITVPQSQVSKQIHIISEDPV